MNKGDVIRVLVIGTVIGTIMTLLTDTKFYINVPAAIVGAIIGTWIARTM